MVFTNGRFLNRHLSRPLTPGIYAPIPTFFHPDTEDLDLATFAAHVVRIASAGVGILICGSMGEAHHLTREERLQLFNAARTALDKAIPSLAHVPIIVGTGGGSTRETVELTKQAAAAGADYSIVIAPGYFAGALANDKKALKAFWKEVSEKSPIPVIVYNYPGASGGIELDSDIIEEMAAENPNLAGVKLTCGNVGKLTRIAGAISDPSFDKLYPRKNPDAPFLVLGGFADFLLPSAYVNAHGAITGLANVAPYALAKLWSLCLASQRDATLLRDAQILQDIIARGDRTLALAGIAGTKETLMRTKGYGGVPRRPLAGMEAKAADALWNHPTVQELLKLEKELEEEAISLERSPLTDDGSLGVADQLLDSLERSPDMTEAEELVAELIPPEKAEKAAPGTPLISGLESLSHPEPQPHPEARPLADDLKAQPTSGAVVEVEHKPVANGGSTEQAVAAA